MGWKRYRRTQAVKNVFLVFTKLVRYENCVIFWNNCSFYYYKMSSSSFRERNDMLLLMAWHNPLKYMSLLSATGILGEIIFLLYFFISYVLHWLCCACLSHLIFCIKSVCVCMNVYFCYLFTTQNQDVVTEIILIFSCDRSEKRIFWFEFKKKSKD